MRSFKQELSNFSANFRVCITLSAVFVFRVFPYSSFVLEPPSCVLENREKLRLFYLLIKESSQNVMIRVIAVSTACAKRRLQAVSFFS